MTPMIDVTFLLIIFFLLSSHLAQQETQLELPLPTAASGHEATEDQTRRLTVNVLADGTLLLGSRPVTRDELPLAIQFEREKSAELEVRIRCDQSVPYQLVEPVLLACARQGIWKVSFAVLREER